MKRNPDMSRIIQIIPAPPGWWLHFEQADQKDLISYPIAAWALLEYEPVYPKQLQLPDQEVVPLLSIPNCRTLVPAHIVDEYTDDQVSDFYTCTYVKPE